MGCIGATIRSSSSWSTADPTAISAERERLGAEDDRRAQASAWNKHTGVANLVLAGRWDEPGEAAHQRERMQDEHPLAASTSSSTSPANLGELQIGGRMLYEQQDDR